MLIPNRMKIAACLAAPASCVDLQETVLQKKGITIEVSMNATQVYKDPESKKQVFEWHHQVKEKDFDKAEKRCTETTQLGEKYNKWKPEFIKIMQKNEFM